jgi:hypothetical protein
MMLLGVQDLAQFEKNNYRFFHSSRPQPQGGMKKTFLPIFA